jgi:hypothetical protein
MAEGVFDAAPIPCRPTKMMNVTALGANAANSYA